MAVNSSFRASFNSAMTFGLPFIHRSLATGLVFDREFSAETFQCPAQFRKPDQHLVQLHADEVAVTLASAIDRLPQKHRIVDLDANRSSRLHRDRGQKAKSPAGGILHPGLQP